MLMKRELRARRGALCFALECCYACVEIIQGMCSHVGSHGPGELAGCDHEDERLMAGLSDPSSWNILYF